MSKKGTPSDAPVADAPEVPTEPINPQGAAQGQDDSDELYLAAERELVSANEPEPEPEPAQPEQSEPEAVEAAQPEQAAQPSRVKIDPNGEYVFVDENGNEHSVKGSDAAWLTQQMHRKVQEKHAEVEKYKPLEQRFQHDKGGLARDILTQASQAERLATVKELLRQDGLTDLAGTIEQRMAQANLHVDPLAPQRALLEAQQNEFRQQQSRLAAQQQLTQDLSALQTSIGRQLTARELAGVDAVYANYLQARQFNPNLPPLPVAQAYKLAVDAMRFEDVQKPQVSRPKQTTPTPAERAAKSGAKSGPATPDDLFYAAMREQNIAI